MVDLDNKDSPEKTEGDCNLRARGSVPTTKPPNQNKTSKPFQLNNSTFPVPNKLQLRKRTKQLQEMGFPPPPQYFFPPAKPIAPRMTAAVGVKLLEATGTRRIVKYSTDFAADQEMLVPPCFQHYLSFTLQQHPKAPAMLEYPVVSSSPPAVPCPRLTVVPASVHRLSSTFAHPPLHTWH